MSRATLAVWPSRRNMLPTSAQLLAVKQENSGWFVRFLAIWEVAVAPPLAL